MNFMLGLAIFEIMLVAEIMVIAVKPDKEASCLSVIMH